MKNYSSGNFRLDFIDGFRGLAVTAVVVFHSGIWAGLQVWRPFSNPFLQILALGRSGVDLFLVLSGFCLFWPLVRRTPEVAPLEINHYFRRRIRRIFPPFYMACILTIAVCYLTYKFGGSSWWGTPFQSLLPWQGLHSWGNLATHALLLHGFSNSYAHSIDGAFWSLSLEWQFYLLFPILVWVCRKSPFWGIVLPFLVTILFRFVAYHENPVWLRSYVGNENALGRWSEFGCGVIAAIIIAGKENSSLSPVSIFKGFFKIFASPFFFTVTFSVAMILECTHPGNFVLPMVYGLSFGSLVAFAGCQQRGILVRLLTWKPLVWLGTISYSVYLIHGSVFQLIALWVSNTSASVHEREFLFMILGPMTVVFFSCFFFKLFERPFMAPKKTLPPNVFSK
jgi:peptidoglycan/LPS O-acetylase OafA/YrhL